MLSAIIRIAEMLATVVYEQVSVTCCFFFFGMRLVASPSNK